MARERRSGMAPNEALILEITTLKDKGEMLFVTNTALGLEDVVRCFYYDHSKLRREEKCCRRSSNIAYGILPPYTALGHDLVRDTIYGYSTLSTDPRAGAS
jgi:hypothetical protein